MKQGWQIKKLGDLYPIRTGKTPSRGDMTLWDGSKQTKNLWVSIADITANEGGLITDTNEYISDKACDKFPIVNKGALLVSFKLSLGRMAFAGANLRTNEAILSLDPIDSIVHRFLYYYLLYFDWDKAAEGDEKVKGKTLNQKKLAVIPIPVPPLSEQQRIVSLLDAEFAKIDTLKANAERNLQNAKDLFQAALKEELRPKDGWELLPLEQVVDENTHISYGIVQPEEDFPNGVPIVRPVDLTDEILVSISGFKRTKPSISEAYKRSVLNGKEILLCVRGTTGVVSLSTKALSGCNTTRGIAPLFISNDLTRKFIYYVIRSEQCQKFIEEHTKGTALKQINIADVKMIPIPLAPQNDQQTIVTRLDTLNERCKTLQANYEKTIALCDDLKQALLRKAFNGEI